MWPAALIVLLAAQDSGEQVPLLEIEKTFSGVIAEGASEVHTPALDARSTGEPTTGVTFRIRVAEGGSYFVDLRSDDFDAYLVVRGPDGSVLGEDDDGWVGRQSRLLLELEADQEYEIVACALRGERGAFELSVQAGKPEPWTETERLTAEDAERAARLEAAIRRHGDPSEPLATLLREFGLEAFRAGRFDAAEAALRRALTVLDALPEKNAASLASVANDLAATLHYLGRTDEAVPWMKRSIQILEEAGAGEEIEVASKKVNLAVLLRNLGRLTEAERLYVEAVPLLERVAGPEHVETANALNGHAVLLLSLGADARALPLFERALAIREKQLGPSDYKVAETLVSLSALKSRMGRRQQAADLAERALGILRATVGSEHPATAAGLVRLAGICRSQSRYEEARECLEESLSIEEKSFGRDHPSSILTLRDLAEVAFLQGRFDDSRSLFERAFAITERSYGTESGLNGRLLNDYSVLLRLEGRLEESRQQLERALAISEAIHGSESLPVATRLNNLAGLLHAQGLAEEAIDLYGRSLEITKAVLGEGHPETAGTLNNLAVVFLERGRHEEALEMFERVLAIEERTWGARHFRVAITLNNLGEALKALGRFDEAQRALERCLAMREEIFGDAHLDTSSSYNNLALLAKARGELEDARRLYERSLECVKDVVPDAHPDRIQTRNNLAELLVELGEYEEARSLLELALSQSSAYLDAEFPTMTEAERIRFVSTAKGPAALLACLSRAGAGDLARSLSIYLDWKGKVTRLQSAALQLEQLANSDLLTSARREIQRLDGRLSAMVLLPSAERDPEFGSTLESLRRERLQAERTLNRDLGLERLLEAPDLSRIEAALPEDTVAIDFHVGREVHAWVVERGEPPLLFTLGSADSLREEQNEFLRQRALRGGEPLGVEASVGPDYRERLWDPLAAAVGDAKTVLVSPDGFLCELPLGVLPLAEGGFLLERHRFAYASDLSRIVLADEPSGQREGSMLAVADVNYYRRADLAAHASEDGGPASRSRIGDSWRPLPATRDEVESLRGLRDYALEWSAPWTVLEGSEATEEAVRAALTGHRYVHLASHGYFEPDHLPSLTRDAERGQDSRALRRSVGLLPGLLSGLVLAGVNAEPDPGRADGYLSAEEIMHLDLSSCDLAVLSACETALGSARAGEGLMSLRRAFEVAGARTVVSSLWKVDDRATATLMKWFYENYWVAGMEKNEALHQAKLRMLRQNRADFGGDARPSTWGAFVLSGDWR